MKTLFISVIKIYQLFSGFIFPNPVCRFEPSCSHYAVEAVDKYGAFRGAIMSFLRLLRCNPLCKGGYDPVK